MKSRIWSVVRGDGGVSVASIAGGLALALAAVVILGLALAGGTSATDVTPKFISGNPDCEDLSQANEVRLDPPSDGTFQLGNGTVTIVIDTDAKTFDWTSTLPVNIVIVKGGPNANAYNYSPPSTGDTGLHSPELRSGRFAGLSHISFCFKPGEVRTATAVAETPTPTATPEDPTETPEKCTDRKGCPTPTPKATATPCAPEGCPPPEPNR